MKVSWAVSAELDRADIFEFIAQDNPLAAVQMDEVFSAAARRLEQHPMIGKAGRIEGTRELIPHESYCLVYEIQDDVVWILAVVHTSREWPAKRA